MSTSTNHNDSTPIYSMFNDRCTQIVTSSYGDPIFRQVPENVGDAFKGNTWSGGRSFVCQSKDLQFDSSKRRQRTYEMRSGFDNLIVRAADAKDCGCAGASKSESTFGNSQL